MWTTLLGIDPDELSSAMPHPKVVTPQTTGNETAFDFGTLDSLPNTDTAIDVLGLDLTSEFEVSSVARSADDQTQNRLESPPSLESEEVQ